MIGTIDINIQAAKPDFPISPVKAFVGSPTSIRLRNVPRRIGEWDITAVTIAANYPDGSSEYASCVLTGGVWTGTVRGCDIPGSSLNGFIVTADGIDEHGETVAGYVLGCGDVEILSRETDVQPGTITFKGDKGDKGDPGSGGAVDSVNGKTGVVQLGADDVGALPAKERVGGGYDLTDIEDINLPSETYVNGEKPILEGDVTEDLGTTDDSKVAQAKAVGEALADKLDKEGGEDVVLNVEEVRASNSMGAPSVEGDELRVSTEDFSGYKTSTGHDLQTEIESVRSDIADATKLTPVYSEWKVEAESDSWRVRNGSVTEGAYTVVACEYSMKNPVTGEWMEWTSYNYQYYSNPDATKLVPDSGPRVIATRQLVGYKLGDKTSPTILTDDAKAALFAGAALIPEFKAAVEACFGNAETTSY